MDIEVKTWLFDVLSAILEIDSFFADSPKMFAAFQNDVRTKRAVERNLEIIGESVSRIMKKDPNFQLNNSRKIIDTRNRISHGYDSVSDDIIWNIVINQLPLLKSQVEKLLGEK